MKFIREHWVAFVGALIAGLILVSPQIVFRLKMGEEFRGVYIGGVDAETYYMRVGEVYGGDLKIASPGLAEYKNFPYTLTPLSEWTAAALGKLFRAAAPEAIVLGSFVFPALLFLILYFLFARMTGEKLLAAAGGAGILLGANLLLFPKDVFHLLFDYKEIAVNIFNRPVNPQISGAYFFFWLLCFWRQITTEKIWPKYIAGVLFGLLFYVYPYSWMLALVIQGLYGIYFLAKRDYARFKTIFLAVAAGLVISIPYWVNFYHLTRSPWYESLTRHQGFIAARKPLFSLLLGLDVLLLLLLRYKFKIRTAAAGLIGVFLLSWAILINQQVVTNLKFFPGHWHWYYFAPFSVFIGLFFLWHLLAKWPRLRKSGFIILMAVFLLNGAFSQMSYYRDSAPVARKYQKYAAVYDWLNTHAAKGSVVVAEEPLSVWIPFYTRSEHYFINFADTLHLVPDSRVKHSFFVKIYLQGARAGNLDDYINQTAPDLYQVLFGYWRRYQLGCQQCYEQSELENLKAEYREFLKQDFLTELKKYRADYLVADPNAAWPKTSLNFAAKIGQAGEFEIYRVR